jgi:hypothetical protein
MAIPCSPALQVRICGILGTLWISGCGPAPADSPDRKNTPVLPGSPQQMQVGTGRGKLSSEEHARCEEQSKLEAVALYPELGVAGTAVNREFVRRYKLYRTINPAFFAEPDWPIRLAAMLAQDLGLDARR